MEHTPKEAEAFSCPMQNKRCCADACMAWRWRYVWIPPTESVRRGAWKKSDKGFCGMVAVEIECGDNS